MSGYIGNQLTAQSADSTIYLPVRQTVLAGSSSAGAPNFMSAGTGLRVTLSAASTPMAIAFAAGFGTYGSQDYVTRLTANASDMTGSDLGATNTNYIFASYINSASVTWGSTLCPPQYGTTFDQTKQALLHFEAADTSTSIVDDYGNTWTAVGNAQVDTAQFKFGAASLLLDGTGDYIETSSITSLGGGSWTSECYVRWNVLPTAANRQVFMATRTASDDSTIILYLYNNAGVTKTEVYLSSLGAGTYDIANGIVGTKTTWSANTWYHFALTYDAFAGKYFVYVDGVQDTSITSAVRIGGFANYRAGRGVNSITTRDMNGWIDEIRISQCCLYPNGTTFTPSASAFLVEGHWFDIVNYQMWEATAASVSAGTNPTLTQRYRVFVGEADTSGAAVTAVRNYAYKGRFVGPFTATLPTISTVISQSHNIGVIPEICKITFENIVTDQGYTPGTRIITGFTTDGALGRALPIRATALSIATTTCSATANTSTNATTGASVALTIASWKYRFEADRGW